MPPAPDCDQLIFSPLTELEKPVRVASQELVEPTAKEVWVQETVVLVVACTTAAVTVNGLTASTLVPQ
jgi:hypothetical protein